MAAIDPVTQHRINALAHDLVTEYEGEFEAEAVRGLMADSAERIAASAAVPDFVALLAYRLTKERLRASRRVDPETRDGHDVVFVSLSGGGRGQIAAALTTLLSSGTVAVHSAGTAVHGQIDPAVSTAIGELGIDVSEAFARPITPEVLRGADIIVTMGHSVGVFDIPEGVVHEDWRVGDPVGAPIEEVRRVREDIEHRVRALLQRLDKTAA